MKKIISKIVVTGFLSINFQYGIAQTNTFPATGNVGIGTAAPASKLDILPANGNAITIRPYGTAAGSTGQIQFKELAANGANYISLKAPDALASNYVLKLPINYGTNGQVMTTNGAGVLSWTTIAGGGGATTSLNNLITTSINQTLIPSSTNVRDLGTAAKGWRNIYATGSLFLDGTKFLDNSGANIFMGANAAASNTTGTENIAIGKSALQLSTSFSHNIAIGDSALYNNGTASGSTAEMNVAIGHAALFSNIYAQQVTAIGFEACRNATNGYYNTALGSKALHECSTGGSNTAIGSFTLQNTNIGYHNTAVGYTAMFYNIDGVRNTAVGSGALLSNTGGDFNVAIGDGAMYYNTGGNRNVAVGVGALQGTTGSEYNVAIGVDAAWEHDQGWNNVFLGANTGTTGNGLFNVIACGQGTIVDASSKALFGNASTDTYGGWADWTDFSDGRYKSNITENVPGIEFIRKLRPVTYKLEATKLDAFYHRDNPLNMSEEGKKYYDMALKEKEQNVYTGFIAQEVEAAAQELNFDFSGVDKPSNENGTYGLRYAKFTVPLVKAVQELDKKNEELTMQNLELKNEIAQIKSVLTPDQQQRLNEQQHTKPALEQNVPNPFNKSTVIKYYAPENFNNAQLKIYSAQGVEMKAYTINQSGKGEITVEANTLAAGIYSYTLIVDGVAADVKQMIVTK